MINDSFTRYLKATTHPDNDTVIAAKVGVSSSTIGRWRSGEIDPRPRQVVALARAYGKSPLGALVAAGYLTEEDMEGEVAVGLTADLDEVSTFALLEELRVRVELMGDLIGWVGSIGDGRGSPVHLGAPALRYAHPGVPPAEADGERYLRALDPYIQQNAEIDGTALYGLRTPYSVDDELARRRRTNVGAAGEDKPDVKQPPATERTAAKKGTRKGEDAPHAD